jgi:hypothetical protein
MSPDARTKGHQRAQVLRCVIELRWSLHIALYSVRAQGWTTMDEWGQRGQYRHVALTQSSRFTSEVPSRSIDLVLMQVPVFSCSTDASSVEV